MGGQSALLVVPSPSTFWFKGLFLLYLIMAGHHLASLFNCDVQRLLEGSVLLKHVLGFMTLYFILMLIELEKDGGTLVHNLLLAVPLYAWFVLSTRCDTRCFLVLVLLLGLMYVLQMVQEAHEKEKKTAEEEPPQQGWLHDHVPRMQTGLLVTSVVVTLVGFLAYMGEKRVEYGKKFRVGVFLVGHPTCRDNGSPTKEPLWRLVTKSLR